MNLHEYQANELLKHYEINVVNGIMIDNIDNIKEKISKLKGPPWVVKA